MDLATGHEHPRRGVKLLRVSAAVVGALVLLVLALPLIVRGPVARWLVARITAGMCGTVRFSGGHVGWAAMIDLTMGRPFPVVIEDLRITGPDDKVAIAAARLEAEVEIHRGGAVIVRRLSMWHGGWRLALDPSVIGTVDVFQSVPPAGRAACLDPRAERPKKPSGGGGGGGSLVLRHVEFHDVDAALEFPTWGMTLDHTQAVGSLAAGGSGPPLLFDVKDIVATGGSVRLGGARGPWETRVLFDHAELTRVGVLPDAPTDLLLVVGAATTGHARLRGHATFRNIFPIAPGKMPSQPPGLDSEIEWTSFGAALEKAQAEWRPRGKWLQRIDGDLHARVQGPFNAIEGMLQIEGGGTKVAARLAQGAADLRIALAGVDTTWMLDPALRPLLGGQLNGRFHATARLAPTFAGIGADIPDADLRLDRRRAPRGPRRYELRIGSDARRTSATEVLTASIGRVRLADATLQLDGLRVAWTGLTAAVDAEVAFPADTPTAQRQRSRVEAKGSLSVAALEDWIPDGLATGPLRVGATARGTLDRVELSLAFPPPSTIGVIGQRFVLPSRLDVVATTDGGVRLPRAELRRLGGGSLSIEGRVGPDDRLAVKLGARDYPLGALPGLSPALRPLLDGALGADLNVTGKTERPAVSGKLNVAALAFRDKPVGDLSADLRLGMESGEITAQVNPGLTLRARVKRRPTLSVDAELDARDRAIGPWLPGPLVGAALTVSGHAQVAYREGAPLTGSASLAVAGPGLSGVRIDGNARGDQASAHIGGQLDVGRWAAFWPHMLKTASGVLDLDLGVTDAIVQPRAKGALRIARDLVVHAAAWPAPIAMVAGGAVELDGTALVVRDVTLSTTGAEARLGGRATIDLFQPERSALALQLAATVDAARFPMRLPSGASASGKLALDARVAGTLAGNPGPRIDGRAELQGLSVRLSPGTPAAHARGVVEAHGEVVRTMGVDVAVDGVGAVRIGTPTAPAQARIVSLSPFRIGAVDVPFSGQNLTVGTPASELYVPDLDAVLRLTGDARGPLAVRGVVDVSGGVLDPSKKGPELGTAPAPQPKVKGAWWKMIPPGLLLDLDLRGSRHGMRVEVPVLPDVTVDFRCHLLATNRGATWTGNLGGDSTYARAAVTVYDWFKSEDLRGCQLTK
jgi:hypothetical protein